MIRSQKILATLALVALLGLAGGSAHAFDDPRSLAFEKNPLSKPGLHQSLLSLDWTRSLFRWEGLSPLQFRTERNWPQRRTLIDRLREKTLRLPFRPVMIGEEPRHRFDPEPSPGVVVHIPFTL